MKNNFKMDAMTDISERIKIAMDRAKVTQTEVAKGCKVKQPTVNGWLNGKAKHIRGENLLLLAKFLNVSDVWLTTGKGSMEPQKTGVAIPANFININKLSRVPLIPMDSIKNWCNDSKTHLLIEGTEFVYTQSKLSDAAFAVTVEDDSMSSEFPKGSFVIVDPDIKPSPGDFVIAFNEQESFIRKFRVKGFDDNGAQIIELHPTNNDYPVIELSKLNLKISGKIIEHTRKI